MEGGNSQGCGAAVGAALTAPLSRFAMWLWQRDLRSSFLRCGPEWGLALGRRGAEGSPHAVMLDAGGGVATVLKPVASRLSCCGDRQFSTLRLVGAPNYPCILCNATLWQRVHVRARACAHNAARAYVPQLAAKQARGLVSCPGTGNARRACRVGEFCRCTGHAWACVDTCACRVAF